MDRDDLHRQIRKIEEEFYQLDQTKKAYHRDTEEILDKDRRQIQNCNEIGYRHYGENDDIIRHLEKNDVLLTRIRYQQSFIDEEIDKVIHKENRRLNDLKDDYSEQVGRTDQREEKKQTRGQE